MALVNPGIAMSFRQPDIQAPNALAQFAQIQQIQGGRQAQELNALKMQEAQAALEERNALRQLNPASADYENQLFRVNPQLGISYRKERATAQAQEAATAESRAKLLDLKLKQSRSFLDTIDPSAPDAPQRYLAWHEANHRDPVIGEALNARGVSAEQARQSIVDAIQRGPAAFAQLLNQSKLGTEKFMEMNKPTTQVIDQSGQRQVIQLPGLGGAPTSVGTFADVPLPAAVEQQKIRIGNATRAVTNVQLPPQEKAEQAERGKMLTQQYSDISKAAGLAAKTLPSIDANLNTLNRGLETGFGTEAKAAGARILGALGVKDAEKFATDTQTFQSNAMQALMQKQLEQKGPQTESDAVRLEQIGAQLAKTKDANRFILDAAREQLRRDMDQRNFYDNWWKNNKTYDGAESAWFAGEGGKSLFDRPALKRYVSPTANATAAQIPTTATPARAAPAAAPAAAVPQAAIDALKAGRGTDAQFDAIFGPGAAKRARGGK